MLSVDRNSTPLQHVLNKVPQTCQTGALCVCHQENRYSNRHTTIRKRATKDCSHCPQPRPKLWHLPASEWSSWTLTSATHTSPRPPGRWSMDSRWACLHAPWQRVMRHTPWLALGTPVRVVTGALSFQVVTRARRQSLRLTALRIGDTLAPRIRPNGYVDCARKAVAPSKSKSESYYF